MLRRSSYVTKKVMDIKMNEEILISIIVPVYNCYNYLGKSIASICNQTYKNLEIILVDDGSTDGSGKLCDEWAEKDNRVKVFHKENGGASTARNLALQYASGMYFGFVDSDDYIDENMYEILLENALKQKANIVQIGRDEIDPDGNKLENICEPPKEAYLVSSEAFLRELLLHKGDCSFCTKLIHRDLFANKKFPEGKLNEDFFLLINMLAEMKQKTENPEAEGVKESQVGEVKADGVKKSQVEEVEADGVKKSQVEEDGVYLLKEQAYHVLYRINSTTRKATANSFSRVYADSIDNANYVEDIVNRSFPALREVSLRFGLFQRIEYLLHIPIAQMTKDNAYYKGVIKYIRNHLIKGCTNKILTGKNKIYLILFATTPKGLRKLHAKLKKIPY